jgi:hypothetical protein
VDISHGPLAPHGRTAHVDVYDPASCMLVQARRWPSDADLACCGFTHLSLQVSGFHAPSSAQLTAARAMRQRCAAAPAVQRCSQLRMTESSEDTEKKPAVKLEQSAVKAEKPAAKADEPTAVNGVNGASKAVATKEDAVVSKPKAAKQTVNLSALNLSVMHAVC